MEPITDWGPSKVAQWLRGLESSVQVYSFEEWQLTGEQLLRLSYQDLERLGVNQIGHQELILEPVELLCTLNYDLKKENLRTVVEKLKAVCHTLQALILSRRKVNTYDGASVQKTSMDLLSSIIEIIAAAKAVFTWLNRYLLMCLSDYSASKEIFILCSDLATCVNKDYTVSEKENRILIACSRLCIICDNILSSSPEGLLSQTAVLQITDLVPTSPGEKLGIEIRSTNSCLHLVSGAAAESPSLYYDKILAGDEVIQVNDQVVVGWTHKNLARKLRENPHGVTLLLKRVPITYTPLSTPTLSPDQVSSYWTIETLRFFIQTDITKEYQVGLGAAIQQQSLYILFLRLLNTCQETTLIPVLPSKDTTQMLCIDGRATEQVHLLSFFFFKTKENSSYEFPHIHSIPNNSPPFYEFPHTDLNADEELSLTQSKQPASDLQPGGPSDSMRAPWCFALPKSSDSILGTLQLTTICHIYCRVLKIEGEKNNLSEVFIQVTMTLLQVKRFDLRKSSSVMRFNILATAEDVFENPEVRKEYQKAKVTMKSSQESESAADHVQKIGVATKLSRRRISCQDLGEADCDGWLLRKKESSVFRVSKWKRCWFILKGHCLYWYESQSDEKAEGFINVPMCNIESAGEHKRKYVFKVSYEKSKSFYFAAENASDMSKWINHLISAINKYKLESPTPSSKEEEYYSETETEDQEEESQKTQSPRHHSNLQKQSEPRVSEDLENRPVNVTTPKKDEEDQEDEMETLLKCLQQGGVSLIGKQQTFTREQYRKSFIKRNKNPIINEKAHTIRALQSTLKAKETELYRINKVLDDLELTSEKFSQWKEENWDLYHEI
uniref:Connector enhancer of kinase suppressor of Ras 1 n=1 Tax=Latimeria chalumnae TaxID=7897 RepID=H3BA80_LATCH